MTTDSEMRRLAEAVAGDPWDRMAAADVAFNQAAREKVPELLDRVAAAEIRAKQADDLDTRNQRLTGDWKAALERAAKAEAEVERVRAILQVGLQGAAQLGYGRVNDFEATIRAALDEGGDDA